MQIDFNNLRKQTCDTYDALAVEMNAVFLKNDPISHIERTTKLMSRLKALIATVACCSDEKAGFADVLGDRNLITFNPED